MIHSALHRFHNPDLGVLLLRVALGLVFAFHGWQKITSIEMTAGFFAQGGIDWMFGALFWTYVVAYTEFIGGLLLIGGLFVRYAAILLAVAMAVAVSVVHWKNGFSLANGGYEYALALLLGSLAVFVMGAGRYSIAAMMKHPAMCDTCEVGMQR